MLRISEEALRTGMSSWSPNLNPKNCFIEKEVANENDQK